MRVTARVGDKTGRTLVSLTPPVNGFSKLVIGPLFLPGANSSFECDSMIQSVRYFYFYYVFNGLCRVSTYFLEYLLKKLVSWKNYILFCF